MMDGFYYKLLHLIVNIPKQIEIKGTKTLKSKKQLCFAFVSVRENKNKRLFVFAIIFYSVSGSGWICKCNM